MTIECIEYKEVNHKSLMGFAKIRILESDLVINGMKLLYSNGKFWCSFPSRTYEAEGEKRYASIVEIEDREKQKDFLSGVTHVILKKRKDMAETSLLSKEVSDLSRSMDEFT